MRRFEYPRDLVGQLRETWAKRWTTSLNVPDEPPTLPGDSILQELLETAYHASFTVDESRSTLIRIVLGPIGPDSGGVRFLEPRPFSVQELRRLAQATDGGRLCIAVACAESTLHVLGVVERANGLPVVRVDAPGSLALCRDAWVLLRLQDGTASWLVGHDGFLILHGAESRFEHAVKDLLEFGGPFGVSTVQWPQLTYFWHLKELIRAIVGHGHGGSLFVVHSTSDVERANLLPPLVRMKYEATEFRPWALMKRACELAYASPRPTAAMNEECARLDREIASAITNLARLTRVDGGVVITDRFELLGFGAEVVASSELTDVFDAVHEVAVPIDAFGTRHRSAFRLCDAWDAVTGIVCSQDGGAKAVWKQDGRVRMALIE